MTVSIGISSSAILLGSFLIIANSLRMQSRVLLIRSSCRHVHGSFDRCALSSRPGSGCFSCTQKKSQSPILSFVLAYCQLVISSRQDAPGNPPTKSLAEFLVMQRTRSDISFFFLFIQYLFRTVRVQIFQINLKRLSKFKSNRKSNIENRILN